MDVPASNRAPASQVNPNDIVATYADVESARAAITILERHGVEGGAISLDVPGAEHQPLSNEAQRDADMEATGKVGRRAGVGLVGGALIGAILGAALGAAASAVFDLYTPMAMALAGALGGGMFGAFAGVFYGGASGLPVSEAWGDSYNAESSDQTGAPRLSVRSVEPDKLDEVVQALRGTGAISLQRADDQGRLADA